MTGRPARSLLTAALLLAVAGCAGSEPPTTSPASTADNASASSPAADSSSERHGSEPAAKRIEVQIADGRVAGDTGRIAVTLGQPVTLSVTSDAADEVHVHGYDVEAELAPGTPVELSFDATIPGVFEVELHGAGTVLLTLQVG